MATHPTVRSLSFWTYQYRRTWRASIASGFLTPVLYLAAMGLGLGSLVNRHAAGAGVGGVSYLAFLAPGLLAASAMQTAGMDSTFPVMASIKWVKTYHAMLATPLGVVDVLHGHLLWIATRVALVSAIFLVVMAAFGTVHSAEAVAALPVAVLTGMAFAAPFAAFTATRDGDQPLIGIYRFIIIPMFLFSGTFFPVSQLPPLARVVAWITPLWHGVSLCRALSLGTATAAASLGHVAYLVAVAGAGVVAARGTYRRRLAA